MKVIWSPRSRRNLNEIFDYILAENPAAAVKVINAIEARVSLLEAHPNLGRPGKIAETRELVIRLRGSRPGSSAGSCRGPND